MKTCLEQEIHQNYEGLERRKTQADRRNAKIANQPIKEEQNFLISGIEPAFDRRKKGLIDRRKTLTNNIKSQEDTFLVSDIKNDITSTEAKDKALQYNVEERRNKDPHQPYSILPIQSGVPPEYDKRK